MKRNLDGCYFRVQHDGAWDDVCFSDLTDEEQDNVLADQTNEWLVSLLGHLVDSLEALGFRVEMPDTQRANLYSNSKSLKNVCKSTASVLRYWGDILNLKRTD